MTKSDGGPNMVKITEVVTRGFPTEVHYCTCTPNSTWDDADADAYANA